MTVDGQDFLTITDVARLSGVRPSAVSNWRNRWQDFPIATEDGRFPRAEIEAWLVQHGRDVRSPAPTDPWVGIWKAADAMRSIAAVEDLLELLLQLLVLRAGVGRGDGPWRQLTQTPDRPIAGALDLFASEIGREDATLGAALEPSSAARRITTAAALPLLSAIESIPRETDWGRFAIGLTSDFPKRFGLRGAESFTPQGLAEILIGLAEPIQGRVYDPACGAGSLLARAALPRLRPDLALYGQEVNAQAERLARLVLHLVGASPTLTLGDTLLDDRLPDLRADRVVTQPPLNQRITFTGSLRHDPRWVSGIPTSSADWLWVQHVAHHLAGGGIGVVALASGALYRGGSDAMIRRSLLAADMVDTVVQLPPAMLPVSGVPLVVVVLERGRQNRTGRVLFIDVSKGGSRERGGLTRLQPGELADVLGSVRTWRRDGDPSRQGTVGIATVNELLEGGSNLLPSRFVGIPAADDESVVARFLQFKSALDEQSRALPSVLETLRSELADIEAVQ